MIPFSLFHSVLWVECNYTRSDLPLLLKSAHHLDINSFLPLMPLYRSIFLFPLSLPFSVLSVILHIREVTSPPPKQPLPSPCTHGSLFPSISVQVVVIFHKYTTQLCMQSFHSSVFNHSILMDFFTLLGSSVTDGLSHSPVNILRATYICLYISLEWGCFPSCTHNSTWSLVLSLWCPSGHRHKLCDSSCIMSMYMFDHLLCEEWTTTRHPFIPDWTTWEIICNFFPLFLREKDKKVVKEDKWKRIQGKKIATKHVL